MRPVDAVPSRRTNRVTRPMRALPSRGPAVLALRADPDGLWWDAERQELLIADDAHDRLLVWSDDGFGDPIRVAPGAGRLGQIVRTQRGTILVAREGAGRAGGISFAQSEGEVGEIPGLDPTRRRLGLHVLGDGRVLTAYFTDEMDGGGIACVSFQGGEEELITGLGQPSGLVSIGDWLYVADRLRGEIVCCSLSLGVQETFACVPEPEYLAVGARDSLYVSSRRGDGVVYRISKWGDVHPIATALLCTRGLAYDRMNRRLFVADHDRDGSSTRLVHVLPDD